VGWSPYIEDMLDISKEMEAASLKKLGPKLSCRSSARNEFNKQSLGLKGLSLAQRKHKAHRFHPRAAK